MILLQQLLVLSNALALVTAESTSSSPLLPGGGVLPWSNHQRPLLPVSIAGGGDDEKRGNHHDEDKWGWIGPHGCVLGWCLWSNPSFARGRGISVITLQENMSQLRATGLGLNQNISTGENPSPPPFEIKPVKGKGLGVVANRTIKPGTSLMTYPPVLVVHKAFLETAPTRERNQLLDRATSVLPASTRAEFEAQAAAGSSSSSSSSPTGHRVTAVLMTNSFQVALPGISSPEHQGRHHQHQHHYYANYPEVSRLNHDCRPNAAFRIAPDTALHHVTAVGGTIRAGDEITISYVDAVAPRDERRARTRLAWGFECTCQACSPRHDALVHLSDARLAEIRRLERRLQDYGDRGVTAAMIQRLLKLYTQESLHAVTFGAYTLAALNYNLLGWDRMAARYAAMAVEAGTVQAGEEAPDVKAMQVLARDPREHFTFRGRLRR